MTPSGILIVSEPHFIKYLLSNITAICTVSSESDCVNPLPEQTGQIWPSPNGTLPDILNLFADLLEIGSKMQLEHRV
jgi:hypothetical protein